MAQLSVNRIFINQFLLVVVAPFSFLIRLLYTNSLTPEEIGMFYGVLGFFAAISIFSAYGFSSSIRHFIPLFDKNKQYTKISTIVWFSFYLQLAILAVVALAMVIFDSFILDWYFGDSNIANLFVILAAFYVLGNIINITTDVYIGMRKEFTAQIIYIVQTASIAVLSVIFFLSGVSHLLYWYAATWSGVVFVVFLVSYLLLFKQKLLRAKPKWDPKLIREFFSYATHVFFGQLSLSVLGRIDIVMITIFLSFTQIAFYSNSFALVEMVATFFSAMSGFLMPYFSYLFAEKKLSLLREIFQTLYELLTFLILPFTLLSALFSQTFLSLLYGSAYADASPVLIVLSIFIMAKILYTYNINFIMGIGYSHKIYRVIVPAIAINIMLNLILVYYYGLIGIAIGTVVSWVYILIASYIIIHGIISLPLKIGTLIKIAVCGGIFLLSVLVFKQVPMHFLLSIGFSVFFSGLVYAMSGYLLGIYTFARLETLLPTPMRKQYRLFRKQYLYFLR